MKDSLVQIKKSQASNKPQLFTCHLLERLAEDICEKVGDNGGSQKARQIVLDTVHLYTTEICQEKPELFNLRRRQSELESAMDSKDQFLAHILQESADAIVTVDREQRVAIWNKGAEAIFGYKSDEIVGQPISRLLPVSREYELHQIEEQTRSRGAVNNRLTQWLTRQGKLIQVILTSTAIHNARGEYSGSSFVIKDITRQREMEDAVRQAEHFSSIGRLAAGLAHEIKNPLAGIQGAIEVIQDKVADATHQSILREVMHEVDRIDKLVRDLLNYAKPKVPEFKFLQLEPLLRRIIHLLRESSGHTVQFVVQGKPVSRKATVLGDESCLEQVLLNLLLNAVEAMGKSGTVRIIFETEAEMLKVRIEDNGPGIPIGLQNKIFDPFFTTKKSGTGLGLATCRRIVHEHGGNLYLDPDFTEGAAFVLRLPLKEKL